MMTGLLHEKPMLDKHFSRKSFLKGGGALIVGFSLAGSALAGKASAIDGDIPTGYNPDINQVDSWLSITSDNLAVLKTSQIETGNGITTGFLQVVAEELDMDMSQMRYGLFNPNSHTVVDTYNAVSSGGEGGSNAMSGTGPKIRNVAALARQALLGMAATQLGVPAAQLTVDKGVVSGGGKTVTYGSLVGGKLFKISGANVALQPGVAPAKPFSAYKTVLKDPNPVTRIDIPDKVTGKYTYVHQVRVPGMMHARMVRPRGQGAYPYNSNVPVSIDPSSIAHVPGAQVVHVNNFLAVVAPKEFDAIQAAAQLKVVWNTNPILPGTGNLWKHYRDVDSAGNIPATLNAASKGNVDAALASAAHTVSGTFKHHYQGHMPIGPSCAVADVGASSATIWSNTQNVYNLVTDLTNVLSPIPAQNIRVLFFEGSGSFGNGCVAFDTAESAAIVSKAIGKPARMQMMRWDEHGWTHFGPAIMYDMRAGIDSAGNIVAYDATGFGQGGTSLYTGRELVGPIGATTPTANALPTSIGGGGAVTENLSPWMKVSSTNYRVTNKPIQMQYGIFHSGPVRAPGAQQTTLADAQIMDMLAIAANMDSLQFRLQNMNTDLDGQRWAAVLQAAAQAAGWKPWVAGSGRHQGQHRQGPRHRQQPPRRRLRGRGRRHHGEQEERQDQRDPRVRGSGLGLLDEPEPDLQPDDGQRHPGHEPCALRGGHVQQEPGDLDRLDHVPDPPLQGLTGRHDGSRAADRSAVARLGRAAHVPDHRRDRERVLRRDGRAPARGPVYAGARSGHIEGGRRQLASRLAQYLPGPGAIRAPVC